MFRSVRETEEIQILTAIQIYASEEIKPRGSLALLSTPEQQLDM